jgi:hypothetical protein
MLRGERQHMRRDALRDSIAVIAFVCESSMRHVASRESWCDITTTSTRA